MLCSDLKSKIRNPIYSVELWKIHKYDGKSYSNLKSMLCARLKQNLSFRFKLSLLVSLSKYWLHLVSIFFYSTQSLTYSHKETVRTKKKNKKQMGFVFSIKKDQAVEEYRNYKERASQILQLKSGHHIRRKVSVFCQQILSWQRARRMLISKGLRKNTSDSNYSAISIDRFSSKTTIGKDSWYFNNSFLCKPDFLSAKKNLLSLLKN